MPLNHQGKLALLSGSVCVACIIFLFIWWVFPCFFVLRQSTFIHESIRAWQQEQILSQEQRSTILRLIQTTKKCSQRTHPITQRLPKKVINTFPTKAQLFIELKEELPTLLSVTERVLQEYDTLTGVNDDAIHQYIVVFQNNMELRPSGGFLGSYGIIEFQHGKFIKFEVQDIYVPDGQLTGHVEPPRPIQEAFQQGFWKLRDANWHPDFPESAQRIIWFLDQVESSSNKKIDGVIAINYSAFESVLNTLDPVYLPDYQMTIDGTSLYPFLQTEVENNFFPGSTKKRDLLKQLSTQVLEQLKNKNSSELTTLISQVVTQLTEKDIQIFSQHAPLQQLWKEHNWDGKLTNTLCGDQCIADYFSIVEANLGVNKSNCCVERSIDITKKIEGDQLHTYTKIIYKNNPAPSALEKLSGNYKTYIRIYQPLGTTLNTFSVNGQSYQAFVQEKREQELLSSITATAVAHGIIDGFSEIGAWVVVPVGETVEVDADFSVSIDPTFSYQLAIQKQSGTQRQFNTLHVTLNNQTLFENIIQKDLILSPTGSL